jgi:hypothetical protein
LASTVRSRADGCRIDVGNRLAENRDCAAGELSDLARGVQMRHAVAASAPATFRILLLLRIRTSNGGTPEDFASVTDWF